MKIDLLKDLIENEIAELSSENVDYDAAFSKKDPVAFLASCIEFKNRRISRAARQTHVSTRLKNSHNYSKYSAKLLHLEGLIQAGGDLLPHQTKRVESFEKNDMLLSDWNIQHLHLGNLPAGGKYADRTGDLLFVLFGLSDAYLIDILDHSNFAEKELLEIVEENWPTILDPFTMRGIVDIRPNPTSAEIKDLRAAGVQVMVKLRSGRVLAPIGGGYSTAKTSVSCMMHAQNSAKILRRCEKLVQDNMDLIKKQLNSTSGTIKLAAIDDQGVVIFDEATQKAMRFKFEHINSVSEE